MSLVMEGADAVDRADDQVHAARAARHVLLVHPRRSTTLTLLNTGMTRDGLFLIENGEIAGPVQNFRWNMSPLVGFNNITARRASRCRCTPARPTTARARRSCRRCASKTST